MRAVSWRVYITPFKDDGTYGSEVDVTKDVDFTSMGTLQRELDNNDYDIGIIKNSNVTITLNNVDGKYSGVDTLESIFRFTRNRSKCRITFALEENGLICGMFRAGFAVLSTEQEIFSGFINDDAAVMSLNDHKIPFAILGKESLFDNEPVPFAALNNGDSVATTIFNLLNVPDITDFLTVHIGNITPGEDQTIDDVSSYQNKNVKDAISDLLLGSSSVLYIISDVIYVAPRTAGATSKKTFYGEASPNGAENISMIDKIVSGFGRIFNYLTWQSDPTIIVTDTVSTDKYTAKQRALDISFWSNATKIRNLLGAILTEFKVPKQEFILSTPCNFDVLALNFLDRVTIDYPSLIVPAVINGAFPICGTAICGSAQLPRRIYNFSVDPPADFKIMNIAINFQNAIMSLKVRRI